MRELVLDIVDDDLTEDLESATLELSLERAGEGETDASLDASSFLLEIADDDVPPCTASATVVCLGDDGRFQVSANYRSQDAAGSGEGPLAVRGTPVTSPSSTTTTWRLW